MADPTDGRWEAIDAFYRDLIEEHGWRLGPLRQFASGLGSGAYGRALFPSTSHDALGLSTVAGSDDRMKRPMVHVHYDPHRGRFLVRYQGPDVREDHREWTDSPEAPEVLARILDWLGVPLESPAPIGQGEE